MNITYFILFHFEQSKVAKNRRVNLLNYWSRRSNQIDMYIVFIIKLHDCCVTFLEKKKKKKSDDWLRSDKE